LGFVVRASESPRRPFAVVTPAAAQVDDDMLEKMVLRTHGAMPGEQLEDVGRMMQTPGVASILDIVPSLPAGLSEGWPVQVVDSQGVFVPLGDGRTVVLANVCGRRSGIELADRTLWRGLLAGRWSLVDHFDTDGRRFLLARKNDPDAPAPDALSARQRQVTFYASHGWSNAEIAYALGLAENTVSAHLHQSLKKLRLSRSELIRLAGEFAEAAGC
jgi:DNA-binding CsgD family transcriptional regulator